MVNTKVAVSGQPAALVVTLVYVPETVYVVPFAAQVYVSQAVTSSVEEVLLLMVKFNTSFTVQPLTSVDVPL